MAYVTIVKAKIWKHWYGFARQCTIYWRFISQIRLNTGVEDTESLRPDGNVFELEQRRIKFSTGYVEVKLDKSRCDTLKTHEDLLRLVNFCKDTLDKKDVKSMIAVQAVGKLEVKYQFFYNFVYYSFFFLW